ncbi:hypothetical protein J1614_005963 [Plenodomus biglobosus]|nr:hypothetical protein J1614_005963 [Plenodomus biglobosus]
MWTTAYLPPFIPPRFKFQPTPSSDCKGPTTIASPTSGRQVHRGAPLINKTNRPISRPEHKEQASYLWWYSKQNSQRWWGQPPHIQTTKTTVTTTEDEGTTQVGPLPKPPQPTEFSTKQLAAQTLRVPIVLHRVRKYLPYCALGRIHRSPIGTYCAWC